MQQTSKLPSQAASDRAVVNHTGYFGAVFCSRKQFPSVDESQIANTMEPSTSRDQRNEVAEPIVDDGWATPPPDFVPSIPEFTADAGIQLPYDNFSPADFASLFFTRDFWTLLVEETNRMADQFDEARPQLGNRSIFHGWQPVDIPEMRKFIGIILLSGLVHKSQMRSFWTSDPLTSTPAFSALMKRDRFEQIMKFFHFNNNKNEPPHTANERDRLYKIRPLLEQLSNSFQKAFTPEKEICIDESLMLYKGGVIFRQYMPLKRARFGIKMFCLTDKNGYLHSFSVYTGKQDPLYNVDSLVPQDAVNLSLTAKTTLALMGPFLDKGYHLYIDNSYTSVALIEYLHQWKTLVTGTARCDRVPKALKNLPVAKGQTAILCKGPLLAQKFPDKKMVYMMTTGHTARTMPRARRGGTEQALPVSIDSYNKHMGGVDRLDQLIEPYDCTRKTVKWYRKLAVHLIQLTVLNAWNLHRYSGGKLAVIGFLRQVVGNLVFHQGNFIAEPSMNENLLRLTGRHFIEQIPATAKERPQKRCRVCSKKGVRRDVRYHCPDCPSKKRALSAALLQSITHLGMLLGIKLHVARICCVHRSSFDVLLFSNSIFNVKFLK
ncbi:hypothetical protein RRG08_002596 [Elysia crispata]|uniref:PiggyBac transposable element-derived protein domain-containing protein n=1 Tax=Elysia crispata TaxID=231223 RepID=A0AAE0Y4N2_9GAST|nr:hypothetical protein RRG08_002596 [Elysia crispata]